jgi:acyl-CoA thioesterase-1
MTSSVTPKRRVVFARLAALVVATLTFASAPSSTASGAESSVQHQHPVLLVVGDSISAEYGLSRDTGWVKLLDARLRERHYDYEIVNASISGETTSGGLSRIDELVTRLKPAIVIVELGGNDALRGLSLDTSQKNLEAIVTRSQRAHAAVLLVGMQVPPNYGKPYGDRFAAMYTATAQRYKTALTPFFFAGFADRFELFQADRIHPSAEAQGRLLDNVWPDLQPLLRR